MIARHSKFRALLLVSFALFTVNACAPTPTTSYWSEAQSPKGNQVEPVRLMHEVNFASGTRISVAEAAQLDSFLARHDVGYGDRVYVLTQPDANGVSTQRLEVVLHHMAMQGVKAVGLASPEAQPGLFRVVVNRHVVVPPNCPDWSKPGTADYSNTPMSNLGCSSALNLGLMVADPSELVRGRDDGPADAAGSVLAIQRYRAGKITPPAKSTTSESTAGGS